MTQQNDDPQIVLGLPLSAINAIMMGLDELPGKIGRRLMGLIQQQVSAQLKPPEPAPEDAPAPEAKPARKRAK